MKNLKLIKKDQIFVLYQYFLFEENDKQFVDFFNLNSFTNNSKNNSNLYQQNFTWFNDFKKKKYQIFTLVNSNLKNGWEVKRLPVFEKAIITSAVYTIQEQNILEKKQLFFLINQIIDFSKKYLEKEKCGYINKLLDLIGKNKIKEQSSTKENDVEKNCII